MCLASLSVLFFVSVLLFFAPTASPASAATLTEKQAELKQASNKLGKLQASFDAIADKYNKAEVRLANIEDAISALENDIARSEKDLGIARAKLGDRVVQLYKNGKSSTADYLEILLSDADLGSIFKRLSLLGKVADDDQRLFDEIESHLADTEVREAELTAKKEAQTSQVEELKALQAEVNDKMKASAQEYKRLKSQVAALKEAARKEAEAKAAAAAAAKAAAAKAKTKAPTSGGNRSGGTVQAGAFVFPVDGPHSFTNTWGAPRSGGRTHKGTDILAPKGTTVVACVSGSVIRTSPTDVGLGGITIWLRGSNGTTYYYAHLDGIASGVYGGASVKAGQTIGWVGCTGNAAGCNHLHFEIHPGGGGAVNPYATLRAAD